MLRPLLLLLLLLLMLLSSLLLLRLVKVLPTGLGGGDFETSVK